MAKKDFAKGTYVVYRFEDGGSLDDEIHIVGKIGECPETLCGGEILPDQDGFSKKQPKTCKGEKLEMCSGCEKKAKKKTKKAPAKKKK